MKRYKADHIRVSEIASDHVNRAATSVQFARYLSLAEQTNIVSKIQDIRWRPKSLYCLAGLLILLALDGRAWCGDLTVRWTPPTHNTDGSAIPTSGEWAIESYRIEHGSCQSPGVFGIPAGALRVAAPAQRAVIADLAPGTYCVRVYARNNLGKESAPSNVASKTIEASAPEPEPPTPNRPREISLAMTTITDNFNRANGGLGANWTAVRGGGANIVSNEVGSGAEAFEGDVWTADSFGADQYAELTLTNLGSGTFRFLLLMVRETGDWPSANADGYFLQIDLVNSQWAIRRIDDTVSTTLLGPTSLTLNAGDRFRIEVSGNTLRAYHNGAELGNTTDSTYSSGRPGLIVGQPTSLKVDDFEAGDLDNVSTATLSSSVGVADASVYGVHRNRLLESLFATDDRAINVFLRHRSLDSAVAEPTDQNLTALLRNRLGDSDLIVTDEFIRQVTGVINAILSDAISVADESISSAYRNRLAEDAIEQLVDTLERFALYTRQAQEGIALDDEGQRWIQYLRSLDDSIETSDLLEAIIHAATAVSPRIVLGTDTPVIQLASDQPLIRLGGYAL